jgi:hypothetical protein
VSTLEAPDADRHQLFNEYDTEGFRQTGRAVASGVVRPAGLLTQLSAACAIAG